MGLYHFLFLNIEGQKLGGNSMRSSKMPKSQSRTSNSKNFYTPAKKNAKFGKPLKHAYIYSIGGSKSKAKNKRSTSSRQPMDNNFGLGHGQLKSIDNMEIAPIKPSSRLNNFLDTSKVDEEDEYGDDFEQSNIISSHPQGKSPSF